MAKYEIARRTFEAKKYPKGSATRANLNKNPLTSEYMVSEKFYVLRDDKLWRSFKTRKEAEIAIKYAKMYR